MGAENKPKSASHTISSKSKKGRQRYLPQNKPVKKKGSYPLRPGVQGFFITCDGGRERQASHESINVIDSFFEELVLGKDSDGNLAKVPSKPLNKKIKFSYSDSSESDDDEDEEEENEGEDKDKDKAEKGKEEDRDATPKEGGASIDSAKSEALDPNKSDDSTENGKGGEANDNKEVDTSHEIKANEAEEPPAKKQCLERDAPKVNPDKVEETSIDKLIEAEIKELADKSKRRFFHLDTGCNGVVFVQMRKRDGDPSPKDIVQHIMTSAAATRKHMSRFILRILPVEVACYASEEEISRAMVPLVQHYFPAETGNPQKFSVLYGARANSGINRMKIIDAVAKAVPKPHKVDLTNPDRAIVVEIVKTVCLIGVIEKYKELAKYNLRQLTSSKP